MLVEHHRSFHKSRGIHRLATLLGNGIFIAEGDEWLRHRRLMQPAFHKASVERYEEVMVRRATAALDRWDSQPDIDVVLEARRLALEIAAESLFGDDIAEAEANEVRDAIEAAAGQLQTRVSSFKMFIPDWVPTGRQPAHERRHPATGRDRLSASSSDVDGSRPTRPTCSRCCWRHPTAAAMAG